MPEVKNTPYKKVIIHAANPEATENMPVNFVGGNGIMVDGNSTIKHYKFQLDKEIELPVPFIEQLKNRHYVFGAKDGEVKKVPIYRVEMV